MMKWDEIKRRLKNGASVQIIADLDGVPYKTMYNRIKWHERQDGIKYMPETKTKKKEKLPDVSTAFDEIPISELATCKYCKNVSHRDNEPFCTMGHVYDGVNGTCSDWRADGKMAPVDIPEVVPDPTPKPGRKLMPETIDEILQTYRQVRELADRYQKQAEDWRFILCSLGVNIPEGDGNG